MKILIITVTLILSYFIASAQTHNLNCDCCRLSKNYEKNCKNLPNESRPCGCPACAEEKKKEEIARKAEDKKRNESQVKEKQANWEKNKKAEDEAYRKKLEEDRKKAEGTKVTISNTTTTNNKPSTAISSNNKSNSKSIAIKKDFSQSKIYAKQINEKGTAESIWTLFLNEKGDTLLKSTEYFTNEYCAWNFSSEWAPNDTATNAAIVKLGNFTNLHPSRDFNIINSKGEKLLDTDAQFIIYGGNNFFICFGTPDRTQSEANVENTTSFSSNNVYVFDNLTKKKYYFKPKGDHPACKVNSVYKLTMKADKISRIDNSENGLLHFYNLECTHMKNEGGWMKGNIYKIVFNKDRQPESPKLLNYQENIYPHK